MAWTTTDGDWIKWKEEPRMGLVAIAVGTAARILVKFGFTQEQSAELMRAAWKIVQE